MAWFCFSAVRLLILLTLFLAISAENERKKTLKALKALKRMKREWILPPAKLYENQNYTHLDYIAKIRSDKDKNRDVEYSLRGAGADKPPYNLFVVDHKTGFIRVTGILDREKFPSYNLTGIAKFKDGSEAEDSIPLVVTVLDENDNPPYFTLHTGSVKELSKKGTFVMQIIGQDDDQDGTINSEIAYSIISQEPKGIGDMFTINSKTGRLHVKDPSLDRETHDFYRLIVKGTDMGGGPGGKTGTGTVEIKVLDINDNVPTLEKSEYSGSVDENVVDVVVMRIKALDKDLEHTDNWLTEFTIAKGNEDKLFSIETDRETNEGILKLIKPVDFEEVQNLELGLILKNVAPFDRGSAVFIDVDVQAGHGEQATGAGLGAGAGLGLGLDADLGLDLDLGLNAGLDAGLDLGLDAGLDAGLGLDVGLDADLDAELDLGLDAGLKPDLGAGLGPGVGVKPGPGPGVGAGPGPGVGVGPGPGPGVGVGLKPGIKPGPGKKPKPKPAKSYPIKIAVNNVPEGPAFKPTTKNIPVSEDPNDAPLDSVLTSFPAIDPDTGKKADDVSYAKFYDPDNWFTIDEETAEIKLNKVPDRESPFLKNGTYVAKILAITKDMPSKTATGTIAIQVKDYNDNCPTLTSTQSSVCSDEKTVYVTAFDNDASPNADPFTFQIMPDGTKGNWAVEVINATTVALHSADALWPGTYELQVKVMDAQGLSCPVDEVFTLDVCTCVDKEGCSSSRLAASQAATSSDFSSHAIGPLITACCLLLLIPLLLLFCQCGGPNTIFPDQFSDLPFDTKEHLINYQTEGKGEDKDVPIHFMPIMMGSKPKTETGPGLVSNGFPSDTYTSSYNDSRQIFRENSSNLIDADDYPFPRDLWNNDEGNDMIVNRQTVVQQSEALYEDIALPDAFLNDYYSQKAQCATLVDESLLLFDFEGQGSSAGSVGCCSLLESDNDLDFLNDLGLKFKSLAEICSPPGTVSKPFPTQKMKSAVKIVADKTDSVVMPQLEREVEAKPADMKPKSVTSSTNMTSSTNISNSSVSSVGTTSSSMTLPHSRITNVSRSASFNHSATLPYPTQTVVLQQQPLYYNPVLQPMQYVVQTNPQNMLLLEDGPHGTNVQGLFVMNDPQSLSRLVMSGTQSSFSGLVIQDPAGARSPQSPASPTSPVRTTVLLPSPTVSQGSIPVEGLTVMAPNPAGTYLLLQDKTRPDEVEVKHLGSSEGILPRDANLVKKAAPP